MVSWCCCAGLGELPNTGHQGSPPAPSLAPGPTATATSQQESAELLGTTLQLPAWGTWLYSAWGDFLAHRAPWRHLPPTLTPCWPHPSGRAAWPALCLCFVSSWTSLEGGTGSPGRRWPWALAEPTGAGFWPQSGPFQRFTGKWGWAGAERQAAPWGLGGRGRRPPPARTKGFCKERSLGLSGLPRGRDTVSGGQARPSLCSLWGPLSL